MARRLRTTNLKDWERRLASLKNNKPLMKQLRAISGEELILVWNQKLGRTLGRQHGCLENCQAVKAEYPESEILGGWIVGCKETDGEDNMFKWFLLSHFNIKRLFRGESEPRVSNVTPVSKSADYHIFLPDSKHHKNPQILESVVCLQKSEHAIAYESPMGAYGRQTKMYNKILIHARARHGRENVMTEDLRFMYAHPNHYYTDEQCKGFPNANKRRVFRNKAHIQAQVYGSRESQIRYCEKTLLEYGFKRKQFHKVFALFFPEYFD